MGFSRMLRKDEENIEEEERKVGVLIFSLLSSHLLLFVTEGAAVKSKGLSFSVLFSTLTSSSFPPKPPCSSSVPFLFLSAFQYQHPFALPDFYPHLSPLPSPPVNHGSTSLYIFLSDSSAGGLGQLKGGVAAISQAPLVSSRVRGWRRKRGRGGGCSAGWSKMISVACFLLCSVQSRFVLPLHAPNGFLMTACRHHTPSHL